MCVVILLILLWCVCVCMCVVVVAAVIVVEWSIKQKQKIIIVSGADLWRFFRHFFWKMCVFVSRPMPLFFGKTVTSQNWLLIPKQNDGNRSGFRQKKLQQQR